MKLYLKIKEYRQQKGLTQKELATKVGIDFQTISNYENGRFIPTIERALEIALALEVTLNELVDMDRYIDEYHKDLKDIYDNL